MGSFLTCSGVAAACCRTATRSPRKSPSRKGRSSSITSLPASNTGPRAMRMATTSPLVRSAANWGRRLLVRRFAMRGATFPREELTVARAWQPLSDAEATLKTVEQPSYRFIPETRHGIWAGFRAFWEATGEAAYLGNPLSEEYIANGVSYQTFERGELRWREGEDITMTPVGEHLADRYDISMAPRPQGTIPTYDEALFMPPVAIPAWDAAPPAPGGGRAVVVSLSQQALWAYEDGAVVRSTYVSTGKEKFRTPTGFFTVNSKTPEQDMAGVIGGESYDVPKVPDVMYFTDRGHALHGTYWHENF